jgi:serine protease Do
MNPKKLILALSLILSFGLVAVGVVYAQGAAATEDPAPPQEPTTPRAATPEFSLLVDGGSFLGVYAEDITKENMGHYGLRDVRGVGVTEIVKGSPAEKAGLKKDDVIVRFEGESVTSMRKLNRLVSETAPEHAVRITIDRGGAEQEVSATLAKRSEPQNVFGTMNPNEFFRDTPFGGMRINPGPLQINPGQDGSVFAFGGGRRIGINTEPLTKQLADFFGVKDGGILITSVTENSPAAKAGLKAGDVVTAVDGEKIESSGDLSRAINKKTDGEVTLTVIRDRSSRTIKVTPEKAPDVFRTRPGASTRRIVIPRVDLPAIPAMSIQLPEILIPRITLPSIPQINVTVPRPVIIRTSTIRNPI